MDAYVNIELERSKKDKSFEKVEAIKKLEGVKEIYRTDCPSYHLLCKTEGKDVDSLHKISKRIRAVEGVRATLMHIVV